MRALLLDFGGPVLKTPFELLRDGERRSGLAAGSLAWTGPFDPDSDPEWQEMTAGGITEREYWRRRATEFARLTGRAPRFTDLMGVLFDADEDTLVRTEARDLIGAARASGVAVGILTNDLLAFHGAEWVARLRVLDDIDVVVDGSVEGTLKPDPAIYRVALSRLGVSAGDVLFVDDQPVNVAGARALGIESLLLDVTSPGDALAAAGRWALRDSVSR